jgi:hypothetical protein
VEFPVTLKSLFRPHYMTWSSRTRVGTMDCSCVHPKTPGSWVTPRILLVATSEAVCETNHWIASAAVTDQANQ